MLARLWVVRCCTWLVLGLGVVASALGGPNGGGTLVVHASPPALDTDCSREEMCDLGSRCVELDRCENAVTRLSSISRSFVIVAAFPGSSEPRMRGVSFGIEYDPELTVFRPWSCAEVEVSDGNWPASGSGTTLSWDAPQTGLLRVVYSFYGQNYYYGYTTPVFRVTPHPTLGGYFRDDSEPSVLDPIVDYGRLGFDTDGYLPCPDSLPPLGACCLQGGVCSELSLSNCDDAGGEFQGPGTTCDPNPCTPVPVLPQTWGGLKQRAR